MALTGVWHAGLPHKLQFYGISGQIFDFDLLDDGSVILLSMLMILLSTKCYQSSDLWQQLEMAAELVSDPRDT